ncbi:MAG: outer membrane protein assembly factor BamB family protein, partial [Candidatus Geothermincolia bacterium]
MESRRRRTGLIGLVASLVLVMVLIAPALAAPLVIDTTWKGFQHDAGNTGYTGGQGPTANDFRWKVSGLVTSGLAVAAGDNVYAGSGDTLVSLYDRKDIVMLNWSFTATSIIRGNPAIDSAGNVIFGTEEGKLYKVSAAGAEIWAIPTGARLSAPPVIDAADNIYFANEAGLVAKLNPAGAAQWQLSLGAAVAVSPALDAGGNLYVGDTGGYLHCITAAGAENWSMSTGSVFEGVQPIMAAPVVAADGKIFVATDGGYIYCVTNVPALLARYTRVWTYRDADERAIRGMALDPAGSLYYTTALGKLRSVATGGSAAQLRWSSDLAEAVSSVPSLDATGRVYVPSRGIQCYRSSDGVRLWGYDAGTTPVSACAIGDKTIYFGV